MKQYKLQFKES
jgi:hypothetical protein